MTANAEARAWAWRNAASLLMKSDDGGFSWQTFDLSKWIRPTLKGSTVFQIPALAVSAQTSKVCYAFVLLNGGGSASLMKTTDGGDTWQDIFSDALFQEVLNFKGGTAPYASWRLLTNTVIAVDPNNGQTILVSLNGKLFRVANGTWKLLPLSPRGIANVAFNPKSPNLIYVASDQGISFSRDAGTSWQTLNRGLLPQEKAYRVAFQGDQVFAQGDNGIYRLTNGATDWIKARWAGLEQKPESDPMGYIADSGNTGNLTAAGAHISVVETNAPAALGTNYSSSANGELSPPILIAPEDGSVFGNYP